MGSSLHKRKQDFVQNIVSDISLDGRRVSLVSWHQRHCQKDGVYQLIFAGSRYDALNCQHARVQDQGQPDRLDAFRAT